jgi:O-antigen ligase
MVSIVIAISQMFINAKIALRKKIYMFLLLVSLVLMLIGIASVSGFDIKQVIDTRILEKESGMESAKARISSYEVFLIKFPEYPWFGVGPETRDDVLRMLDGVPIIHVGYLSYLYFYGIVGCLLLFICFFYLLRYAWIIGKKHAFWGSFYGLFTFCFANVTFVYFNLSEMGVVLAVIYLKYFNDKSNELLPQNTV